VSVVVITGANCGIGLALAEQFTKRGDDVIACVRSNSPELKATGAEIYDGIDLCDGEAIQGFCEKIAGRPIDILVNNASTYNDRNLVEDIDVDAVRKEFETNVLGPLQLTKGLLPEIVKGGKIVFISSSLGSIEENETGSSVGYRMSKSATNMLAKTLCNELWERFISTTTIHPGIVPTKMSEFSGIRLPEDAAKGVISRIDKLSLDTSGMFWHQDGRQILW